MRAALKWQHKFIDTEDTLKAMAKLMKTTGQGQGVAVDIEAFCVEKNSRHLGQVSLLQLCSPVDPSVYIVDVLTLGPDRVAHYVNRFLAHPEIRKYMYDCRKDVEAMSTQMGLTPANVCDLQLYHTATLWTTRGTNRRSNLDWALRNLLELPVSAEHKSVEAAFSLGNRKVWDERPLPEHLISYAANDVRHLQVLAEYFKEKHPDIEDKVVELSARYVAHYATGALTEKDVDPAANMVSQDMLRDVFGPGGRCEHCGGRGHDASNCFKKDLSSLRCSHCGDPSHLTSNCFKLHPEKNKCGYCGQAGHTESKCFQLHPCPKCGGKHRPESCKHEARIAAKKAATAKAADAAKKSGDADVDVRVGGADAPPASRGPRRMEGDQAGSDFERGRGRGGFDGSRGRGGFDASRGRGGFDGSRGRGGFDDSRGRGRGGFDGNRGGRGGFGRGGYDDGRGRGRGGFDGNRGGRGGFDGGRGRGGFDNGRGRGGFDGGRGGRRFNLPAE